jgi:hypothetical protein
MLSQCLNAGSAFRYRPPTAPRRASGYGFRSVVDVGLSRSSCEDRRMANALNKPTDQPLDVAAWSDNVIVTGDRAKTIPTWSRTALPSNSSAVGSQVTRKPHGQVGKASDPRLDHAADFSPRSSATIVRHRIFDAPLEDDGFEERVVELCRQPCRIELEGGRIG